MDWPGRDPGPLRNWRRYVEQDMKMAINIARVRICKKAVAVNWDWYSAEETEYKYEDSAAVYNIIVQYKEGIHINVDKSHGRTDSKVDKLQKPECEHRETTF
jgi:hypothetical protein